MSKSSQATGLTELLKTARAQFLQWGYSGTSIASLALELGVSKAALYYHFRDKEALFLGVFSEYLHALHEDLAHTAPLFEQPDRDRALCALADVFLVQHPASVQVQQLAMQESRQLTDDGHAQLTALYHENMVRPLTALLQQAEQRQWLQPKTDLNPETIWVFMGLLSAFTPPDHSDTQDPARTKAFVDMLVRALS
ncbi:MAG: TetR/AcrR family transcriptional regulator [Reinekea sp.]|nr:TetR/AcrR family transcriptional regulator [Reinekea sp.]